MSNTIQVKRGSNASLPTLNAGEFGFSTDTHQVYIGDGVDNYELVLFSKLLTTSGSLQGSIDSISSAVEYIASSPDSDHSAEGPKCNDINAGESVTAMQCVYLKSDGEWWKTNASSVATALGMLALSLESKLDGEAMTVALPGCFVRDDTWNWTVGDVLYLSTTAGSLTPTAPSGTEEVIRIAGYATHADRLFFDPDKTIVVHV